MKSVAVLLLAAALVLGMGTWEAAPPGRFETSLPGREGVAGLRVVLHDSTGLVRGFGRAAIHRSDGVSNPEGEPNVLLVNFLTGTCEDLAQLWFRPAGDGYDLRLTLSTSPFHGGGLCHLLVGIGRSLTITLAQPLSAESVVFEQH